MKAEYIKDYDGVCIITGDIAYRINPENVIPFINQLSRAYDEMNDEFRPRFSSTCAIPVDSANHASVSVEEYTKVLRENHKLENAFEITKSNLRRVEQNYTQELTANSIMRDKLIAQEADIKFMRVALFIHAILWIFFLLVLA